jgi:hypothetical protein
MLQQASHYAGCRYLKDNIPIFKEFNSALSIIMGYDNLVRPTNLKLEEEKDSNPQMYS